MTFRTKTMVTWVGAVAFALLAQLAQAKPVIPNLGVNGDFEHGSPPHNWGRTGNANGVNTVVHGGSNSFGFTPSGDAVTGSVSQSVSLLHFEDYALSFFLKGNRSALSVSFGGVILPITQFSDDDEAAKDGDWYQYLGLIGGSSGGEMLFSFSSNIGGLPLYLDDVSISCVVSLTGDCTGVSKDNNNDVPEPGSLLLVGAALASIAAVRRRKQV